MYFRTKYRLLEQCVPEEGKISRFFTSFLQLSNDFYFPYFPSSTISYIVERTSDRSQGNFFWGAQMIINITRRFLQQQQSGIQQPRNASKRVDRHQERDFGPQTSSLHLTVEGKSYVFYGFLIKVASFPKLTSLHSNYFQLNSRSSAKSEKFAEKLADATKISKGNQKALLKTKSESNIFARLRIIPRQTYCR